jgi:hypothetical protein
VTPARPRPYGHHCPAPAGRKIAVQVGKQRLTLSNLDRQLYPDGYSNCEVINYYSHIAEVLLPHLAGRPVTFVRFPDGVGGQQFFEKNVPNGAPDWLPSTGSRSGRGEGENEYALLPPDLLMTSGSKDAYPDYGSQVRWDNVYRTRTAT